MNDHNSIIEAQLQQFFIKLETIPKEDQIMAFYQFFFFKVKDYILPQFYNQTKLQISKFLETIEDYGNSIEGFGRLLELSRLADYYFLKSEGKDYESSAHKMLEFHFPLFLKAIESVVNCDKCELLQSLLEALDEPKLMVMFQEEINSQFLILWNTFIKAKAIVTPSSRGPYGEVLPTFIENTSFDILGYVASLVGLDKHGVLDSKFPLIEEMYHTALKDIDQLPESYFYWPWDAMESAPTREKLKYSAFRNLVRAAHNTGWFSKKFINLLDYSSLLPEKFKNLGLQSLIKIISREKSYSKHFKVPSRIQFSQETLARVEEHILNRLNTIDHQWYQIEVFQTLFDLLRCIGLEEKYWFKFIEVIPKLHEVSRYKAIYGLFTYTTASIVKKFPYVYKNLLRYLINNIDKCDNYYDTYYSISRSTVIGGLKKRFLTLINSLDDVPNKCKYDALGSIFTITKDTGWLTNNLPLMLQKVKDISGKDVFMLFSFVYKTIEPTPLLEKFLPEIKSTYDYVVDSIKEHINDLGMGAQSQWEQLLDIALKHDWIEEYFLDFLHTCKNLKGVTKFAKQIAFYNFINKTKSTNLVQKYWNQITTLYSQLLDEGKPFRSNKRYLDIEKKLVQLFSEF